MRVEVGGRAQRTSGRACRAFLGLLLAVGVAAPAHAQIDEETPEQIVEKADADDDGKLQRSEAPIELLPTFREMDRDGDNGIDAFEIWQFRRQRRMAAERERRAAEAPQVERRPITTLEELVERRDRNGDGKLSLDEAPRAMHEAILRMDQNGDAALDLDEVRVARERRESRSEGANSPAPRRRTLTRAVQRGDTNGDGRLTYREAPLGLQRVFEQYDLNGDGRIDLEEAAKADAEAAAAER